jgi:preprotein translocase subunit SecG
MVQITSSLQSSTIIDWRTIIIFFLFFALVVILRIMVGKVIKRIETEKHKKSRNIRKESKKK